MKKLSVEFGENSTPHVEQSGIATNDEYKHGIALLVLALATKSDMTIKDAFLSVLDSIAEIKPTFQIETTVL
jgi:hypothetical protein